MRDELRQPFALLPRRSEPWIWISEPCQSRVDKFIRGRSTSARTLPVDRPAKNELCRAILFSSHSPEPMVDQRGLSDPGPRNDGSDICIPVCPRIVQKSDLL